MSQISQPIYQQCTVCGGTHRPLRYEWLFICSQCGLLSSTLQPEIPFRAGTSIINEERRAWGLHDIRARNNAIILDAVVEQFADGRSKRLLDVGSGLGFFLKDASDRGFAVLGIEPDANAVRRARETGIIVRHGYFPECLQPEELFEVIVFNDVFEHVSRIVETLDACKKHLVQHGVLVLNCPSRTGIFYRLADVLDRLGIHGPFNRLWQRNMPSPHLWYFSPADLSRLGQHQGLKTVKVMELLPITLRGITHRIFNVRGQSCPTGASALVATFLLAPLLSILPRDIGVVLLQKE